MCERVAAAVCCTMKSCFRRNLDAFVRPGFLLFSTLLFLICCFIKRVYYPLLNYQAERLQQNPQLVRCLRLVCYPYGYCNRSAHRKAIDKRSFPLHAMHSAHSVEKRIVQSRSETAVVQPKEYVHGLTKTVLSTLAAAASTSAVDCIRLRWNVCCWNALPM